MQPVKPLLCGIKHFGLIGALMSFFWLLHPVMATVEPDVRQDNLTGAPTDGTPLLAEVVVTDDGGFELYTLRGSARERSLVATLTPEDIGAAKALAVALGQGVQIVPLADDVMSAQLALRLPQVFAVSKDQCALMADDADGRTGATFFDC